MCGAQLIAASEQHLAAALRLQVHDRPLTALTQRRLVRLLSCLPHVYVRVVCGCIILQAGGNVRQLNKAERLLRSALTTCASKCGLSVGSTDTSSGGASLQTEVEQVLRDREGGAAGAASREALIATATACNNLAIHLKLVTVTSPGVDVDTTGAGKLAEAEVLYRTAIHMRAVVLGDKHPDTVTAEYNLAELFLCVLCVGRCRVRLFQCRLIVSMTDSDVLAQSHCT